LVITFFVCLGVTIALTILGGWQVFLISMSETTIEFYTNKRDARALRKEGKVGGSTFNTHTHNTPTPTPTTHTHTHTHTHAHTHTHTHTHILYIASSLKQQKHAMKTDVVANNPIKDLRSSTAPM